MLENTEGAIKNGQSKETGNIGYTRRRQTKQKHNTICVGQHYTQTNTNNVNKTQALLYALRCDSLRYTGNFLGVKIAYDIYANYHISHLGFCS